MNAKKELNVSRIKERNVFPAMFFGYYTMAVCLSTHRRFCSTPFSLTAYKGHLLIMCVTGTTFSIALFAMVKKFLSVLELSVTSWIYHSTGKSGSETQRKKSMIL